jgi:hypothetical protein
MRPGRPQSDTTKKLTEPIKPNKMHTYVLHVIIGSTHRVDRVNADYRRLNDGCYEFFVTVDEREELVAAYPINLTIIFRKERV